MINITSHAAARWNERFPGMDMESALDSATCRIGRKMRKRIKESCPGNAEYCTRKYNGRYFKMTKDRIVFVISGKPGDQVIITVLDFRRTINEAIK